MPKPLRALMTDPTGGIIDFYPEKFECDPNGKKYKWLWIALLPFIEEERLLKVVTSVDDKLTEEEKMRNSHGDDILYVHQR